MKVALVNGSPHKSGATYGALNVIKDELEKENIDASIVWIGEKPITGCLGCGGCKQSGKCVTDDIVNEFALLAKDYDGFIFGTPVHYSAMSSTLKSFMDRLFFSSKKSGAYYLKPAAGIAVCRRAGTTDAVDQINKYFTLAEMPVISSRYWNVVYGTNKDEILKDEEGVQILRVLAKNMAFFLKCKEVGLKNGVKLPTTETPISTNFIK